MMEALVCILIVIGLMEFREYRAHKAHRETIGSLKKLVAIVELQTKELTSVKSCLASLLAQGDADRETINKIAEAAEDAKLSGQTILREYELNGVPLGYQRKPVDAIEGL